MKKYFNIFFVLAISFTLNACTNASIGNDFYMISEVNSNVNNTSEQSYQYNSNHNFCTNTNFIIFEPTILLEAEEGIVTFEEICGVALVPIYKVDANSSLQITKDSISFKLKFFISEKDYATMVEKFKTQDFKEKQVKEHFSSYGYYDSGTAQEGEGTLYLEKTQNGYSSGIWFLKNDYLDNDYYCVAAHINAPNPYQAYTKDDRPLRIKAKSSDDPIQTIASKSFLDGINLKDNVK